MAKRTRPAPLESGIEERVAATGRQSRRGPRQRTTIRLYVQKHDTTLTEKPTSCWKTNRNWSVCEANPHRAELYSIWDALQSHHDTHAPLTHVVTATTKSFVCFLNQNFPFERMPK